MTARGAVRGAWRRHPALHGLLFGLTILSTFYVGLVSFPATTLDEALIQGATYSAALLGILLSHEMGHWVAARRRAVPATLPYFLPFPFSLVGTLGAVIVMRGRIRSRDALLEVGAAGPLAGMIVALPLLAIGLALSPTGPIPAGGLVEGDSILYWLLKRLVIGPLPAGHDVLLGPVAWAGWVGLLVTALNLLPIGQLDGGHVAYALWGRRHRRVSRAFFAGVLALGLGLAAHGALGAPPGWEERLVAATPGVSWIVLGALLLVLGRRGLEHPPTDDEALSPGHRRIAWLCVVLFVIVFVPVPLTPLP